MASSDLSARLRYLNDAAHLLAATAPETSRHLLLQHNALLEDSTLDAPVAQKYKACGACGTLMILGWNGTLETTRSRRNGRGRPPVLKQEKTMLYRCDCCDRKTRQTLPISPKAPRAKPGMSKAIPEALSVPTKPSQLTPSSSSSSTAKKRAKNRKQGSLQAILAKQKESQGVSRSGFGLDLMDFMKNG